MVVGTALAVSLLVLLAAYIYDATRSQMIAAGVRVGAIDVGGLSADAAFERLRQRLDVPLQRDVVVQGPNRSFTLTPADAGVRIDTRALVDAAVHVSRGGFFLTRAVRDLTGGSVRRVIRATVTFSRSVVSGLAAVVAQAVDRPARDATVVPSASGLHEQAQATGVAVEQGRLRLRIDHALEDPSAAHTISAPTLRLRPNVTISELAARYPAYIIVDRAGFRLLFFQHLRLSVIYPVSIGRQGLQTPAGLYDVQWKQVNPPWHVPNDSWAGALAGKTIPPGPQDPIKARWMAFNGGAGIHGTDVVSSIGHAASHGCVRMRIPDVIALYDRTPVGTPVFVV